MRIVMFGAVLSASVFAIGLSGCANAPISTTSFETSKLKFDRTQSHFREVALALDSKTVVTLENTHRGSPRRVEHIAEASTIATPAPKEILGAAALAAIAKIFPHYELDLRAVESGPAFAYATFQQVHEGVPVLGAEIVLQLTKQGDWLTANSTLIAPEKLPKYDSRLSQIEIDSKFYIDEPHRIISSQEIFYPRGDDAGNLEIFQAREISISLNETSAEWVLWIDQNGLEVVGATKVSTHLDQLHISGSIVPNKPADSPTSTFFPFAALFASDGQRRLANEAGSVSLADVMGPQLTVKLENDQITVVANSRPNPGFVFDIETLASSEISIDSGPGLEERNVYHWLMVAKKHLKDHFQYTQASKKLIAITNFGENLDNAFFMPLTYSLSFGTGKQFLKNTAHSRDVIIHEFGHSMIYEKYGMNTSYEFSAMNEAMADYLAAIITEDPQIADGVMHERTGLPYLRTVENDFRYPENFTGEGFHNDGQIFSGALWDMRKALGAKVADSMVHEAQMAKAKTIYEFYKTLLAIDERTDDLNPFTPSKNFHAIRKAFFKHGIGSPTVKFQPGPPKDYTQPWKSGCWSIH